MNRKSNEWLIGVLSVVILLFDIIPLAPNWVKQWVSLILGVLIVDLLVIWFVSDRNLNRLTLMKPILLPLLNANIDYNKKDKYGSSIHIELPTIAEDNLKKYFKDVNLYLNKSKDTREPFRLINEHIKKHNDELKTLIDNLNLKITTFVRQKIPNEWDESNPPEPRKYYTKHLYTEIGNRVQNYNEKRYGKREPLSLARNQDGTGVWKLSIGFTLVASDNEKDIDDIEKMIKSSFNTVIRSPDFEKLNNCFERIRIECDDYKKQIAREMKNVENWILLKD